MSNLETEMEELNEKTTPIVGDFLDSKDKCRETKMIRDAYNNMDCMSGIYTPHYFHILGIIFFGILTTCFFGFLIGVFIFLMIRYPGVGGYIGLSIATVIVSFIWFCVMKNLNCGWRKVYFYKHNGKLVTIHYSKYLRYFGICLDNDKFYQYNFRKKSWKEERIKFGHFMGTYLLFPYYFSENAKYNKGLYKVKNKMKYGSKDRLTISSERDYEKRWQYHSFFKFEKDNLISIKCKRRYRCYTAPNVDSAIQFHYLRIKEINKVNCISVPKSFIDFCNEQEIEPPIECEHLHYVEEPFSLN